jgi:hypothetical protein
MAQVILWTSNSISRDENFVLLHYCAYFFKYVCSVESGCFL